VAGLKIGHGELEIGNCSLTVGRAHGGEIAIYLVLMGTTPPLPQ
jgi:hypothetical protein